LNVYPDLCFIDDSPELLSAFFHPVYSPPDFLASSRLCIARLPEPDDSGRPRRQTPLPVFLTAGGCIHCHAHDFAAGLSFFWQQDRRISSLQMKNR
jgi:hypothetical protein